MPQLLPEGSHNEIPVTGGSPLLNNRPALAGFVAEVIATWSQVELAQLDIFVRLMGGPFNTASSMFLSLASSGPKSAAITAIAETTLPEDERLILRALLKRCKSQQKQRDKIAHWIWGYSNDYPDALTLHHPQGFADPRKLDRPYIYREEDFKRIIRANARLCDLLLWFYYAIAREPLERASIFQQLLAEPEVQEAVQLSHSATSSI